MRSSGEEKGFLPNVFEADCFLDNCDNGGNCFFRSVFSLKNNYNWMMRIIRIRKENL